MLNCAVTCRSTDKKPCDNKLSIAAPKLVDGLNDLIGGESMSKLMETTSSEFAKAFTNKAFIDIDVSKFTDDLSSSLGRYLPLCRVTGTDHRVNSTKVLPGLR